MLQLQRVQGGDTPASGSQPQKPSLAPNVEGHVQSRLGGHRNTGCVQESSREAGSSVGARPERHPCKLCETSGMLHGERAVSLEGSQTRM